MFQPSADEPLPMAELLDFNINCGSIICLMTKILIFVIIPLTKRLKCYKIQCSAVKRNAAKKLLLSSLILQSVVF